MGRKPALAPKPTLEIVTAPAGMEFADRPAGSRVGFYPKTLTDVLAVKDGTIRIGIKDQYSRTQLREAAKRMKLELTYATQGEYLFIKPVSVSADRNRLMEYLREPRTEAALNLAGHAKLLKRLAAEKLAHLFKGKWTLTESGFDELGGEKRV